MKQAFRTGFSFGLTTGIITTLGLMIGLYSGTHSYLTVIGGILIIAIADALADSMGIHISQESENEHTQKEIWQSTLATFVTKFMFTLTFLIPLLVFELSTAVLIGVAWGLVALGVLSFSIAKRERAKPWKVILEHLLIAVAVIITTYFIGMWISSVIA
jgi:VIT1/CCC1 family predicted Fe2+/Mn2+ transporter